MQRRVPCLAAEAAAADEQTVNHLHQTLPFGTTRLLCGCYLLQPRRSVSVLVMQVLVRLVNSL